jgi:hypothetical protein
MWDHGSSTLCVGLKKRLVIYQYNGLEFLEVSLPLLTRSLRRTEVRWLQMHSYVDLRWPQTLLKFGREAVVLPHV